MDDLAKRDQGPGLQTPEKTLEFLLKIQDEQLKRTEAIIEENETLSEIYQQMCRLSKDIKDDSPQKLAKPEKEAYKFDQDAFSDNPETEKAIAKLQRELRAIDSLCEDVAMEIEGFKKQINKSNSVNQETRDYIKSLDEKILTKINHIDALEYHLGVKKILKKEI